MRSHAMARKQPGAVSNRCVASGGVLSRCPGGNLGEACAGQAAAEVGKAHGGLRGSTVCTVAKAHHYIG